MRYVTLASNEYRKGRMLLFCSRFSRRINNASANNLFVRRCLEWLSYSKTTDSIRVCSVVYNVVDGNVLKLHDLDRVQFASAELSDLSDSSFFSGFDVLVFNGMNNEISPLIYLNMMDFVSNGGGLLLCDLNLSEDYLDMLSSIAPVYVQTSGVNIASGFNLWTEEGQQNPIYDSSFSGVPVVLLNTVQEDGVSSNWTVLSVFDTDYTPNLEEDYGDEDDDEVPIPSSDFDIDGAYFTAYLRCVYEDGLMKITESSSSSSSSATG